MNRNHEAQLKAGQLAAQQRDSLIREQEKLEAFSDYAGHHETDSHVPQETGASIRNNSIQPTNPMFSL
jgi:hypothetical protein